MANEKETKAAEQEKKPIRVIAGTYTATCGNFAQKLKKELEAAGLNDFKVAPAADLPGYIMVAKECSTEADAQKLIEDAKAKKIRLTM